MSSENQSSGTGTVNPVIGAFGNALNEYMEGFGQSQDDWEASWNTDQAALNKILADAVSNIGVGRRRRQAPQLTPEAQRVVLGMQQFPVLVPVFNKLLDQYTAEVAAAYAAINDKYTKGTPNEVQPNQSTGS